MKSSSKYDLILFMQIMILCMGEIGGAFQFSRIVAILLFPLLLFKIGKKGYAYAKHIMIVFLLFYLYFLYSCLWTPDIEEAIKELVYYLVHFILFLELIVFARNAYNPLKSISRGWLIAVLLCSIVAYWEITTDNHLSTAKEQSDAYNVGGVILQHMTASVTFGNYNGYVTFLCYSFPWIFFILLDKDRLLIEKLLSIIALITASLAIVINASRGGLLTVMAMLAIYYFFSKKSLWKTLVLTAVVMIVGYVIINYGEAITAVMEARASDSGMFSDDSRFVIWSNALNAYVDSWGFGVGIGGMTAAMERYAHGDIAITHNMFLEILMQYGIVITLIVFLFLFNLLKNSFTKEWSRKVVLLMALLTMPIYTIINSGYLLAPHLYALIATIYIFANYELIKYPNGGLRKVT